MLLAFWNRFYNRALVGTPTLNRSSFSRGEDQVMSESPLEEAGLEDSAEQASGTDDFDADLGDGGKTAHVAPILPPK